MEFIIGLIVGLVAGADVALLAYLIWVIGGESDAHIEQCPTPRAQQTRNNGERIEMIQLAQWIYDLSVLIQRAFRAMGYAMGYVIAGGVYALARLVARLGGLR